MSARQSDPLTVVTQDGSTWWKHAVDRDGRGLYRRGDSTEACPTLRTIRQLAEFGLKSMPAVNDDPFGLRRTYRVSHDLPETGGAR